MKFCSSNYTLIWSNIYIKNSGIYEIDKDNFPRGPLMDHFIKIFFLDKIENIKKHCRFIWASSAGNYNQLNQSYDGGIGLVADSKADIFIRPIDYFIDDSKIGFTDSVGSEYIYSLEIIEKKMNIKKEKNLISLYNFLIPNLNFIFTILIGVLIYFISLLLISFIKKNKLIRLIMGEKFKNQNLSHKILSATFAIFSFFLIYLFSANLNTINVIVDISNLLYTKEKVLETKKELCFLDESSEQNYLLKATKDTIPYKIFEKINKQDQCFLYRSNNLGNLIDRDPTQVFIVVLVFLSNFVSKTAKLVFKKDTFLSDIPLYESVRCFIIKKTLNEEIKKFLNICINAHLKFGFMNKIVKDFDILFNSQFFKTNNDELISYIGLRHYIKDNSKIGPLTFEQLDYVFRIYFVIQILILIIGLIHYFIIYFKNLNLIHYIYRIKFYF